MEGLLIRRTLELDCPVDELWRLVSEPDEVESWLGRDVELDLRPGGQGRLTDDDGTVRHLAIDGVVEGEHLQLPVVASGGRRGDLDGRVRHRAGRAREPTGHHRDGGRLRADRHRRGDVVGLPRAVALALRLRAGQGLIDPVDTLFDALADPTRRRLLQRLVQDGPDTASRLAVDLPVTRQAVVKHLQALVEAGLAAPERHGREVRYRATPEPLAQAVSWLVSAGARWDDRLGRLDRLARREGAGSGLP